MWHQFLQHVSVPLTMQRVTLIFNSAPLVISELERELDGMSQGSSLPQGKPNPSLRWPSGGTQPLMTPRQAHIWNMAFSYAQLSREICPEGPACQLSHLGDTLSWLLVNHQPWSLLTGLKAASLRENRTVHIRTAVWSQMFTAPGQAREAWFTWHTQRYYMYLLNTSGQQPTESI